MDFEELVGAGKYYLIGGGIAAVILTALFIIGYFIIYKNKMKGEKKISVLEVVWCVMLVTYVYALIGATIMATHKIPAKGGIVPLLYLYKAAWREFSNAEWKNIINNFLMFIPLGIWIPLGVKRLRSFWKIYIIGFSTSVILELIQLISPRGVFEVDDLLGNTVGTMIGYGLFALAMAIYEWLKMKKKIDFKRLFILQMPVVFTISSFAIVFGIYSLQDIGNNPYEYIDSSDTDTLKVTLNTELSDEIPTLLTYERHELTAEEAEEMGRNMFAKLGVIIDEKKTVIEDDSLVIYSKGDKEYSLWIEFSDGTYQLYDFEASIVEVADKKKKGASEDTIRKALKKYGVVVPAKAEFKELDDGHYQFKANRLISNEEIVNGTIICDYHGDGKFTSVHSSMVVYLPYKDYEAKSEMDAYHDIEEGKFTYLLEDDLDIKVNGCSITYITDSKGYFQPAYSFDCEINGEQDSLMIPAY